MAHPSARGEIAAWVETEAARFGRRDLSSAFYPEGIELAGDELAAEVRGELVTWLGREEATRARKRYRLVFAMAGGADRVVAVRGKGGGALNLSGRERFCRDPGSRVFCGAEARTRRWASH